MDAQTARAFLLDRLGLSGPYWPAAESARKALDLGMIQIDSIRITGLRNHELAWAARSAAPPEAFYDLCYRERAFLETHYPLFATRRDWVPYFLKDFTKAISDPARFKALRPLMRQVKKRIAEEGPISPADLDSERVIGGFNTIKATTKALEYLFIAGEIQIAGRTAHFHRLFDLTERVAPELREPIPDWRRGHKDFFVRSALDVLKLATPQQLAERTSHHLARWRGGGLPIARRLVAEARERLPIASFEATIGGERREYLAWQSDLDAFAAGRGSARPSEADEIVRIVPPLDNLLFNRRRFTDLFGHVYKFEAYTPKRARRFYFAMPILYRDHLAGLIDAKKDGADWQIRHLDILRPIAGPHLRQAIHRLAAIAGAERVTLHRRLAGEWRRAIDGPIAAEDRAP